MKKKILNFGIILCMLITMAVVPVGAEMSSEFKLNAESRFVVAKSTLGSATVDGDNVFTLQVLGSDARLYIAPNAMIYDLRAGTSYAAIHTFSADYLQGKAFYYKVDADGYVDAIYVIFDGDAAANNTATVLANAGTLGIIQASDWTSVLFGHPQEDFRLVYGLVSEVDSSSITFVSDATATFIFGKPMMDTADIERFNFASGAVKYSYDKNSTTASKKADKITENGLAKSNFNLFKYEADPSYVWKKLATDAADTSIAKAGAGDDWRDDANYAIAMVVNEQVVAVYEVLDGDYESTAAKGTIEIGTAKGKAGDTVDITVSLQNNPGITSMLLNIGYNSDVLTLTGVTDAGVLGNVVHSDNFKSPYSLYWSNGTEESNYEVNGKIATLTFKINDDAVTGDYPITVSYDSGNIINYHLNPVLFDTEDGIINVVNFIYGDVNADYDVTAKDEVYLARYLAGWKGYEVIEADAADVNNDGKINSIDNVILARYLANWNGYETLPY